MLGSMTVRTLGALLLLVLLVGCGTASAPSPPTGVDQLVVPTPSPDPADFVETVDNPWFPLRPDAAWIYEVNDSDGRHRMDVRVEPGGTIEAVPVTARISAGRGPDVTDWYAQDVHGNVWWFGREGEWEAGVDGAEAGLVMAASPRVGDGYRLAYADGVVEDRAVVVSLEDDELVVEVRSELEPGTVTTLTYERGIGPVELDRVGTDFRVERFVD